MKRAVFAFMLAIPLVLILTLSAQADESRVEGGTPELRFDGTTATCSVSCRANNAKDKVEATLTLYQGESFVDSWNNSGTGRVFISGSCAVKSGKSYKLVLEYSINGIARQAKEITGTCP